MDTCGFLTPGDWTESTMEMEEEYIKTMNEEEEDANFQHISHPENQLDEYISAGEFREREIHEQPPNDQIQQYRNDINAIRNYDRLPINKGRRPQFQRNEPNIYPANEIKSVGKNMNYLNAHQRAAKDIAKDKGRIYIIYLIIVMNTLLISFKKRSNYLEILNLT